MNIIRYIYVLQRGSGERGLEPLQEQQVDNSHKLKCWPNTRELDIEPAIGENYSKSSTARFNIFFSLSIVNQTNNIFMMIFFLFIRCLSMDVIIVAKTAHEVFACCWRAWKASEERWKNRTTSKKKHIEKSQLNLSKRAISIFHFSDSLFHIIDFSYIKIIVN